MKRIIRTIAAWAFLGALFATAPAAAEGWPPPDPCEPVVSIVMIGEPEPDPCPPPPEASWCSPGYWRQPHHMDSWAATGLSPSDLYLDHFGSDTLKKKAASSSPTLLEVLQSPQTYGGEAFNLVGDLLSGAHPEVGFTGDRLEDSCPLS